MELTHLQAREMIQFEADSALSMDSLRILKSHLAACEACRLYSDSIHVMEKHLRRAMTKRLNLRPAPLAIDIIKSNLYSKTIQRTQLATRLTMITAAGLLVLVFGLRFTGTAKDNQTNRLPLVVPLIPTPSLQTTNTVASTTQSCEEIKYMVQPNDTLGSIAEKFSITKADLMEKNLLGSEPIISGTEILIPLCTSTPTGTVHPPTYTTTITPLTDVKSQTPDG